MSTVRELLGNVSDTSCTVVSLTQTKGHGLLDACDT